MANLNNSQRNKLAKSLSTALSLRVDPSGDISFVSKGVEVQIEEDRTIHLKGPGGSKVLPGKGFSGRGFMGAMVDAILVEVDGLIAEPVEAQEAPRPVQVQREVPRRVRRAVHGGRIFSSKAG